MDPTCIATRKEPGGDVTEPHNAPRGWKHNHVYISIDEIQLEESDANTHTHTQTHLSIFLSTICKE